MTKQKPPAELSTGIIPEQLEGPDISGLIGARATEATVATEMLPTTASSEATLTVDSGVLPPPTPPPINPSAIPIA